MKKSSGLHFLPQLMIMLIVCFCVKGYGQPDYSFKNPTLYSGTDLKTNAVYKYLAVKPGVDAYMTITFISPGITLNTLDGASGYAEAIQPTIDVPAWTNGYVEMSITFMKAGTLTPMVQPKVYVTGIDIDGSKNYDGNNRNLYEFDAADVGGGYVDFNTLGGELSIGQSGNMYTATNIAGVDYAGRDTAAKTVMFTVANVNVTTFIIRAGINNQTSSAASRLASFYFKQFVYANSILASGTSVRLKRQLTATYASPVFNVLPNNIQSSARLAINAKTDGWAILEIVDYSGRLMMQQQIVVNKGMNNIPLFNISQLGRGSYIAVLKMDGEVFNNKIIRQ